jgi:hypothetical protein
MVATLGPKTLALRDRIEALFGTRDVHPADRRLIRDAFVEGSTWDTLPQDIRDLIERLERELPLQSWDDPADAPDDI